MQYVDLAPAIYRQRCVVEGIPSQAITPEQIRGYLSALSRVTAMHVIREPETSFCGEFGWAGWIHWSTSGAHFYAWDQPQLFFSVDAYTCKAFDPGMVTAFTAEFFNAEVITCRSF
jgi:S-adenosylmethionine decarboxylase